MCDRSSWFVQVEAIKTFIEGGSQVYPALSENSDRSYCYCSVGAEADSGLEAREDSPVGGRGARYEAGHQSIGIFRLAHSLLAW